MQKKLCLNKEYFEKPIHEKFEAYIVDVKKDFRKTWGNNNFSNLIKIKRKSRTCNIFDNKKYLGILYL